LKSPRGFQAEFEAKFDLVINDASMTSAKKLVLFKMDLIGKDALLLIDSKPAMGLSLWIVDSFVNRQAMEFISCATKFKIFSNSNGSNEVDEEIFLFFFY
jgi:hypothetical protein